ncbi:MAG: solute:sodium symporter family transporter, partial [Verrucomicrobiota bacterium]|nr:solute:sodium symporter family transporter [Verrucomicrobiota bacterium]
MIQFIAFLIFTGLVGFFSWRATRRDSHNTAAGYFLAGRSLPWIVVGGSLLLTNLSTEQLVGLNGGAFANGMQVMAWEVWSSIAIVLMALVFLPRYLKGGVATVSLFLERRYSKAVGTAVSVLLLLSLLTNLLPFVLYSGALFMLKVFNIEQILNVNQAQALWITVIALGVVGSLYAIFGGLKAVAISDTFNGIGLLIGGLLIPVLGLIVLGNELGGGGGFGSGIS